MALFKIFKGNNINNAVSPSENTEGWAFYDINSKLFYIDAKYDGNTVSRQPLNAAHAGVTGTALNGIFYGECGTAQATKAKQVTIINRDKDNFVLQKGVVILIKFNYASTTVDTENPMTLNVNNTGAKKIIAYKNSYTEQLMGNNFSTGWRTGAIVPFVYDGESWVRFFWENSKVTQKNDTVNENRPLLMTPEVPGENTTEQNTTVFNEQITANPSTGVLTAKGLKTNSIEFENGCEIRSNAINNFYFRVQEIERNADGKPVNAQGEPLTEDDKSDFIGLGTYINTVVATDKALRPPTSNSGEVDLGDPEALWRNVYAKTLHGKLDWSEITSKPILSTLTIGTSSCQVFADADINIPIYDGTYS